MKKTSKPKKAMGGKTDSAYMAKGGTKGKVSSKGMGGSTYKYGGKKG
jgi:hypothetical protein